MLYDVNCVGITYGNCMAWRVCSIWYQ